MSLIILEGLDRTGKTSVASLYEAQGYEIIHMSAPPKNQTPDIFLEEMIEIISSAAHKDILLDRSYYGEACVWPLIYGRNPLLDEQGLEVLREVENAVGTVRILMHDPDVNAHWQRCVDNNEPLTKSQFVKAKALYANMAEKYDFDKRTLKDFPNVSQKDTAISKSSNSDSVPVNDEAANDTSQIRSNKSEMARKTREQLKLERANVINEILSKRILKSKGPMYDELERNIRSFLTVELGKIFGTNNTDSGFSNDEIQLLKFFCQRLKEKETN